MRGSSRRCLGAMQYYLRSSDSLICGSPRSTPLLTPLQTPLPVRMVVLAAAVIANSNLASAQMKEPAVPSSTRAGVYTAEQAERGRIMYAGLCRSCHSAASHAGTTFEKWWKGRTVADLFAYTSTQMPKNDPGSMNPDEYADVIAYVLKLNAMPTGARALAADSASLATVLIEMPRKALKRGIAPKTRSKPPTRTHED